MSICVGSRDTDGRKNGMEFQEVSGGQAGSDLGLEKIGATMSGLDASRDKCLPRGRKEGKRGFNDRAGGFLKEEASTGQSRDSIKSWKAT